MPNPAHQFQPGKSGNPGGRRDAALVAETMAIVAREPISKKDKRLKLRGLADALFEKALNGDVQAAKEILDRMAGKAPQQQILSGDPEAPVRIVSDEPMSTEEWVAQYGIAANQD